MRTLLYLRVICESLASNNSVSKRVGYLSFRLLLGSPFCRNLVNFITINIISCWTLGLPNVRQTGRPAQRYSYPSGFRNLNQVVALSCWWSTDTVSSGPWRDSLSPSIISSTSDVSRPANWQSTWVWRQVILLVYVVYFILLLCHFEVCLFRQANFATAFLITVIFIKNRLDKITQRCLISRY